MIGNNADKSNSHKSSQQIRETCKAIVLFTPLLVLIVCCAIVVLLGYNKFVYYSRYANFIFNKSAVIENVCEDNPYRNADAKKMVNSITVDNSDEDKVTTHEIIYPYYGDLYANMTIDNKDVGVNDSPIYWGDSDKLLDKGLCQSSYSAYIGSTGRVVVAGHNHTFFKNLHDVKSGDIVTLTTEYGKFTYKVNETKILHENDTSLLYYDPTVENPTDDLIVYTCWNNGRRGRTVNRLYVICEVVSKEYFN